MQKRLINKLNKLCGECEYLQGLIAAQCERDKTGKTRKVYESVADAKNELIRALNEAENS